MKSEIKYLLLIIFAILSGLVLSALLSAKPAAGGFDIAPGSVQFTDAEGKAHTLPRTWNGRGHLASVLGLSLESRIQFDPASGNTPVLRYRIGAADAHESQIALQPLRVKGSTRFQWVDGDNSYEFVQTDGKEGADLLVMRNRVRYLVPLVNSQDATARANAAEVTTVARNVVREAVYLVAPRFIFLLLLYVIVAGGFYLVVWGLLKRKLAARKVQEGWPKKGRLAAELGHSTIVLLAMALFSFGSVFVVESGYSKLYKDVATYGWAYWIFSLVFIFLLMDAFTYWTHRMMHHRSIFRYFHAIHHRSHHPSPWTTLSMSVNEIILNAIFMPAVLMLMPVHQHIAIVFTLLTLFKNVFNHLGFELFPQWINKWLVGATFHETHHMSFHGNYSSYFTFWDRWMKTETRQYEDNVERLRNRLEEARAN